MGLIVRSITFADLAAAVNILREGSLSPDDERPEELDSYWASVLETRARKGDVIVAELNGQVAGVCQVIVFAHFQHAGRSCCELESVHVRSDLRSQGIGAAMLRHAEEIARREHCYRMQLTSRNVRTDAHRFYLANGFIDTSHGFKKSLVD
jgi:GNAT superfamily N-acetyltransferase